MKKRTFSSKQITLGSDPEIGCGFMNASAKTDLIDTFRGGHPKKIVIQLSELQRQIQISIHN
jgi:hypothetical protein